MCVILAFGMFLVVGMAQASTIIYQDSFTGTDGTVLTAHTPETRLSYQGGSDTAAWYFPPDSTAADVTLSNNTAGKGSLPTDDSLTVFTADLPFTPQTGQVYTLSMDFVSVGGSPSGQWMGVGFTDDRTIAGIVEQTAFDWFINTNAGTTYTISGPGTIGLVTLGTSYTGRHTFTSILDTTNAADYSFTWKIDGNVVGGPVSFGGVPAINNVAFGYSTSGLGYVDNLVLTTSLTTPEPSMLALLGTGVIGLLAYAWRKRR